MPGKTPVLLTVFIETQAWRWYVAGIELSGEVLPLLCSEPGNLDAYRGLTFDEQVSFLRHRLSGVLQRGCDRLWGRDRKPCQIVFLTDGPFADAAPELASAVGQHMAEWMTRPPVAFYEISDGDEQQLECLAGTLEPEYLSAWRSGAKALVAATDEPTHWELVPTPVRPGSAN